MKKKGPSPHIYNNQLSCSYQDDNVPHQINSMRETLSLIDYFGDITVPQKNMNIKFALS